MTFVKYLKKTVTDTTPLYAAVGVTDLAVETLRDARTRAAAVHVDLSVSAIQERAAKRLEKVTELAQEIPAQVKTQTTEVADKAGETYSELAVRGEKLVARIRNQKSTKDLLAQAGNTVSLGKGAVTTVRKAALDTQNAAKETLATGRREAVSVAASVQDRVSATTRLVSNGAATTVDAADDSVDDVKTSAASAERATKAAATSARKTAASAAKAAKTATSKIGD